jgi:ATP synthase subunit G
MSKNAKKELDSSTNNAISMLIKAENKAKEAIDQAKKRRANLMKKAKDDSLLEVDSFRKDFEEHINRLAKDNNFEQDLMGKKINKDTHEKSVNLKNLYENNYKQILTSIIDKVMSPDVKFHENLDLNSIPDNVISSNNNDYLYTAFISNNSNYDNIVLNDNYLDNVLNSSDSNSGSNSVSNSIISEINLNQFDLEKKCECKSKTELIFENHLRVLQNHLDNNTTPDQLWPNNYPYPYINNFENLITQYGSLTKSLQTTILELIINYINTEILGYFHNNIAHF